MKELYLTIFLYFIILSFTSSYVNVAIYKIDTASPLLGRAKRETSTIRPSSSHMDHICDREKVAAFRALFMGPNYLSTQNADLFSGKRKSIDTSAAAYSLCMIDNNDMAMPSSRQKIRHDKVIRSSRPSASMFSLHGGNIDSMGDNINGTSFPTAQESSDVAEKYKRFSFGFSGFASFLRSILGTVILDPDLLSISTKLSSAIIFVYIALSILGTLGIDTKPVLSLFSVVGITVGLALKDILTNTFAGLFVIFAPPFKRGWTISVEGKITLS